MAIQGNSKPLGGSPPPPGWAAPLVSRCPAVSSVEALATGLTWQLQAWLPCKQRTSIVSSTQRAVTPLLRYADRSPGRHPAVSSLPVTPDSRLRTTLPRGPSSSSAPPGEFGASLVPGREVVAEQSQEEEEGGRERMCVMEQLFPAAASEEGFQTVCTQAGSSKQRLPAAGTAGPGTRASRTLPSAQGALPAREAFL